MPIDQIRKAAIDAHIPLIEEAGQDAYWYDIAEAVPGPTTELMAQYAKKYQMAIIAMGSEDKDELVVAEQLP
jgi:N-carbamoylputrescine amidase